MKFIKFLFKLILIILLLAFVGIIILGFVCFDYSSKFDNSNLKQYTTIEQDVSSSLKKSLNNIKESEYEDSSNNIKIVFEGDSDLGYQSINRLFAEQFEYTDGLLFGSGAAGIKNILLYPVKDGNYNIGIKLELKLIGFYSTSIKVLGKAKYKNGIIEANFDKYKLGPVPVFEWLVKMLPVQKLNYKGEIFTIEKTDTAFEVKIDLNNILEANIDNQFLKVILESEKDVSFNEKDLTIEMDTSKLFKNKYNIKDYSNAPSGFTTKVAQIAVKKKLELNEEEFNYLIKDNLDKVTEKFENELKFGGKTFNVSSDGTYFRFTDSSIISNVKINDTYLPIKATININNIKDGDYVSKIVISKKKITLGSTEVGDFEFENIEIDASTLNLGTEYDITDVKFENSKIIITYDI